MIEEGGIHKKDYNNEHADGDDSNMKEWHPMFFSGIMAIRMQES